MSHIEVISLIAVLLYILYSFETTNAAGRKRNEYDRAARDFERHLAHLDAQLDREFSRHV